MTRFVPFDTHVLAPVNTHYTHTKRGRICSPSWVAPDLVISPLALSPPAGSPTDITPTAPLTHITPPPPRRAEHNPAPPTVHHNYITTPQLSKQVP
ncbi:hypothetical protein PCANC_11762 [Puccinia coronata f. sp. avenae]|uniref:Uncharacterized protein n=1 Tax=Puccinia coronata f. sp. avenae TaxID=200324 RepID=A0A2N5STI3_9BASI|nr:hypothetical protein PCANC_15019 [Puccinia coronata f. sp. avenae]PLW42624.1 hypothetical protein PCANC_11762 [Puccinia coronata f. sp. avenae]